MEIFVHFLFPCEVTSSLVVPFNGLKYRQKMGHWNRNSYQMTFCRKQANATQTKESEVHSCFKECEKTIMTRIMYNHSVKKKLMSKDSDSSVIDVLCNKTIHDSYSYSNTILDS